MTIEMPVEESLFEWRNMINSWEVDDAKKIRPALLKRVEATGEPHLMDLYSLISVGYYRLNKEPGKADKVMKSLADDIENLTYSNKLRFYALRGADAMNIRDYRAAFEDLYEAYKLDKDIKIAGFGLYCSLASCLTMFGFSNLAIEFFKKARSLCDETEVALIYVNAPLAICYSRVGMFDKAMEALDECAHIEKMKPRSTPNFGQIFYSYAYMHMKQRDYGEALEYCECAIGRADEGSREYLTSLLLKAKIHSLMGDISSMEKCVEEGIVASQRFETIHIQFNAYKHLCTLSDPDSMEYMTKVAIPTSLRERRYQMVIEYYDKLSIHFRSQGKYEETLDYMKLAREYVEKLIGGDLT